MKPSANARIDASSRLKPSRGCFRAVLPALLVPIMALAGCVTIHGAPSASVRWRPDRRLPLAAWWACLNDPQLSVLTERALETAAVRSAAPTAAQIDLPYQITARYLALRARQTALVLLAAREQIDSRLLANALRRVAADPKPVALAEARLAATRADQARVRADIAALRERLAVLTGSALFVIDRSDGGPIPLPPPARVPGCPGDVLALGPRDPGPSPASVAALARYRAAQAAAGRAQSQAEHARTAAAQEMYARGHDPVNDEALASDRQALAALLTEEQARGAMTEAYVALARSWRLGAYRAAN